MPINRSIPDADGGASGDAEARGVLNNRLSRRSLGKPAVMLAAAAAMPAAAATAPPDAGLDVESRVRALEPELERRIENGMTAFDTPGVAVGIVAKHGLVYARGFGRRRKGGNEPVGTRTVFQIGSTTKAFGSAALALAVDRGRLKWDDRVADLYPTFALKDPYVTREFRVFDLFAQRSGLPPYANDLLSGLGFDPDWLVRTLRFVEPATSFRSTFT